jgi:hypothetical protein
MHLKTVWDSISKWEHSAYAWTLCNTMEWICIS